MREIKFRAWYHTEKRMIDWNEMQDNSIESLDTYFRGVFGDVSPVMQYTGLKDKNGKEIYEGDIVKYSHQEKVAAVKYERGTYVLEGTNYGLVFFDDVEVVGNIYEHKHLLEERQHV